MITICCLIIAFVVLILTFVGGERLSNAGGAGMPSPLEGRIDPFLNRPFRSRVGMMPRDLLALTLGVLACLMLLEHSTAGRWIGLAFSLLGIYNGGATAGEFFIARLYARSGVALLGLIMSATAGTYFVWLGRGIIQP